MSGDTGLYSDMTCQGSLPGNPFRRKSSLWVAWSESTLAFPGLFQSPVAF